MSEASSVSIAGAGRGDPQPDGFACQLSDDLRELRFMDPRAARAARADRAA